MKIEELVPYIDFTSLNATDTEESILNLINRSKEYLKNGYQVAGICAYSNFAHLLVSQLKDTKIQSVVVAASFPHGQAPIEVKALDVEMASKAGVDEIDIVLSRNLLLSEDFDGLKKELDSLRLKAATSKLKVIIETGEIESLELIKKASEICIDAGADFLKTSTGKAIEGATLPKFEIMCQVILTHFTQTGKRVGIKAAGGIGSIESANQYVRCVKENIGSEWLKPELFRIGASSLLKELDKKFG